MDCREEGRVEGILDFQDTILISGVYRTIKIIPGSGSNPNTKTGTGPFRVKRGTRCLL
jgi:hypothetical protein